MLGHVGSDTCRQISSGVGQHLPGTVLLPAQQRSPDAPTSPGRVDLAVHNGADIHVIRRSGVNRGPSAQLSTAVEATEAISQGSLGGGQRVGYLMAGGPGCLNDRLAALQHVVQR